MALIVMWRTLKRSSDLLDRQLRGDRANRIEAAVLEYLDAFLDGLGGLKIPLATDAAPARESMRQIDRAVSRLTLVLGESRLPGLLLQVGESLFLSSGFAEVLRAKLPAELLHELQFDTTYSAGQHVRWISENLTKWVHANAAGRLEVEGHLEVIGARADELKVRLHDDAVSARGQFRTN